MHYRLILITLLAACGPEKSTSNDGSGDTTDSAGSNTDTPTAANTDTPTGSNTEPPPDTTTELPTDTTTAEPAACEMFASPSFDTFTPVEITIVNKRSEPVWIEAFGCIGLPDLEIIAPDIENVFSEPGPCTPTVCDDFIGAADCTQSCDDCAPAVARRIGPGQSFSINWSGANFVSMDMTAACAPGENCQRKCLRPQAVDPGGYAVVLTVFGECDGPCECDDPDPSVSCALTESIVTGDPIVVDVSMNYPDDAKVELVIPQ